MQQITEASRGDTRENRMPFRPLVAYSADTERRAVDDWMRGNGLWRTALYHLLQRHADLRLAVEDDALVYRPIAPGSFRTSLRADHEAWRIDAGSLTGRFETATLAAGIFCAAVSGDARILATPAARGLTLQRLQLAGGRDAWIDVLIAEDRCARAASACLVNPRPAERR